MIQEHFGSYGFQFLDAVTPSVIQLHGVGCEKRVSDYDWDNASRQGELYLFQYTLSGTGLLYVEGRAQAVPPGEGFFVKLPGPERYCLPETPGEGWHFLWIMVSGCAVEPYFAQIRARCGALFALSPQASPIVFLRELYTKARSGQIQTAFVAEELAFRFVCKLGGTLLGPRSNLSARVSRAKQLIETEFAALQGVSELAACLEVSPAHLSREFAEQTGSTLMETLMRARLRQAVVLLRDCTLTVDEVAKRCGFSCGNYFGKVFKKALGLSPEQFRRDALIRTYSEILV